MAHPRDKAKLCGNCMKIFRNWEKLAEIQYTGVLYSSINVVEIESNVLNGCELCAQLFDSIPENVWKMWKIKKPVQDLRLSVDLRGFERQGSKLYVLRLEYGLGVVDIYIIPVSGRFRAKPCSVLLLHS